MLAPVGARCALVNTRHTRAYLWGLAYLCKLVDGQALAAGLLNASTSGGGETEGSDAELGHFEETV